MAILHADVVVVGNELAGYAAGALLAAAGRRVVIADEFGPYEEKKLGPFLAPTFPSFWQIPAAGPINRIFEQLQIKADVRQAFGHKSEFALINDPIERLLIDPLPAQLATEFLRAFGPAGSTIAQRLEEQDGSAKLAALEEVTFLHDQGFFARRRKKKRLKIAGADGDLNHLQGAPKAIAEGPFGNYLRAITPFTQYAQTPSTAGLHLPFRYLSQGLFLPFFNHASAIGALRSAFAQVLERHGAEIVQNPVTQIEGSAKKAELVRLDGPNDFVPKILIDARPSALPTNMTILRQVVPRSVIPKTFPRLSMMVQKPSILGFFHAFKPQVIGRSFETESHNDLVVAVLACFGDDAKTQMSNLLPFSEGFVVHEDFLSGAAAQSIWPRFDNAAESIFTSQSNVFRASREIAPIFGIDGEIAAAKAISRAAKKLLGA